MKKFAIIFTVCIAHILAFAQAGKVPSKASVAIYGVKAIPALEKKIKADGRAESLERIAQAMDSQLSSAIADTRKFTVLARSDWSSILREQDFGQSGNVDPATAAKIGKMLGATYVLETTIDDFQDYVEIATFPTLGKTAEKRVLRYGAVAKLYDATTGALVESANLVLTNDDVAELPSYSTRTGNLNDALIGDMARIMAKKIAARISDVAFPAKIISVIGNQIIINRGDGTGIAVGDTYRIMAMGEAMIDPDTGENLGSAEADVGLAVITEVTPKFSKGILRENYGVERGQTARKISEVLPSTAVKKDSEIPRQSSGESGR